MTTPDKETAMLAGTEETHSHRWRIGAQEGATSRGVCACGAEKEFANSWDREQGGRAWTSSSRGAR